jgi:hypothetical protein
VCTAACTLANLQDAANSYPSSLTAGAAFANATCQEKNKAVDVKNGLLSQAMKIDHNKTIFYTTACATYSELIITNLKAPYVIGTQVRLDANNNVNLIDTIVTSTGDWQFNTTKSFAIILKEDWGTHYPSRQVRYPDNCPSSRGCIYGIFGARML